MIGHNKWVDERQNTFHYLNLQPKKETLPGYLGSCAQDRVTGGWGWRLKLMRGKLDEMS